MKTRLILLMAIITIALADAQTTTIFFDNFDAPGVSNNQWHIPTWVSSNDGTYLGRTQLRCSQNSGLPATSNGQAVINVETYNPTGFSFYGTDLISNKSFSPGNGLIVTVRARINSPVPGGIVGAFYFYDLTGAGTIHDEIDFELLTNRMNEVHTNIYSDEPMGAGHPEHVTIAGSITEYHTYVIKWLPYEVCFLVDDQIIRTITDLVPNGPMHFNMEMWVPGADFSAAYNENLQPVNSISSNKIYSMLVDYVKIDSLLSPSTTSITDEQDTHFSIYPNPAHDFIYFTPSEKISFRIYNISGEMILYEKEITEARLSVEALPPGIYVVRIVHYRNVRNVKLIKY